MRIIDDTGWLETGSTATKYGIVREYERLMEFDQALEVYEFQSVQHALRNTIKQGLGLPGEDFEMHRLPTDPKRFSYVVYSHKLEVRK